MKIYKIDDIEIEVEYKPRNKNSYLSIDSDAKVRFKTAMRSGFKIEAFLRERLGWIREKQLQISLRESKKVTLGVDVLLEGELVSLLECPTLLKMCQRLHVKDEESLSRCYNRFYLQKAREELTLHVKQLSEETNLYPSDLRFRKMKRQWGNCNSKGVITLNTSLIKLNKEHRAYVIIHELSHLKHMNHSRDFYRLVYKLCPKAREIEKELKNIHFH
jgi:predicted metal-dependent hydrolase